jgi:hypothetical protein
MTTKLVLLLTTVLVSTGCADEKPSVVSRERLAFLEHQQEPLLLNAAIQRMGPSPPGRGPHQFGPYYGYHIRETNTFVEFWFGGGPVEDEDKICMVVESSPGAKGRIIWPKRLVGTDPYEILKKEWPKMYQ